MAVRLAALLPRFVVLTLLWLLTTATLTFAAEKRISASPAGSSAAVTGRPVIVVPDVSGQAYVFAKGMLEDAGFAWHVSGSVQGYAANVVAGQTPAPGTRVFDTGRSQARESRAREGCAQDACEEEGRSQGPDPPYPACGFRRSRRAEGATEGDAFAGTRPASRQLARRASTPE